MGKHSGGITDENSDWIYAQMLMWRDRALTAEALLFEADTPKLYFLKELYEDTTRKCNRGQSINNKRSKRKGNSDNQRIAK